MKELFANYQIPNDPEALQQELNRLLENYKSRYNKEEHLKKVFGFIDYTSLNTTDTSRQLAEKAAKINNFHNIPRHVGIPNVAAFVVFPRFVGDLKKVMKTQYVKIAAVAAGFPASQTFHELKLKEIEMALDAGANEVDVVISVGELLEGNYEIVLNEILDFKKAVGKKHLKVILETGALIYPDKIFKAAVLAMEGGADFIKTSTGKGYPGASTFSAYVMVNAIKQYFDNSGRRVGFKPAGGISKPAQAAEYSTLVGEILGKQWLTKDYFRIGASRLANNILGRIIQTDINDADARNYF